MNPPENPSRPEARELFLAALEKPSPVERAAFLVQACEGDAGLLEEVEELLAHHQGDAFLENPAMSLPTVLVSPVEQPGEWIGPYKMLEQIGEGGFGTVWVAEQEKPIRRRVALKVIKPGMDTREVIARFAQERQALAMMDHPNIAKVFDAGATSSGRPYFVMELVRGIRITDYCDQANLPAEQRLELFIQVCQAVQHAHQKGIIHRDLKPSNILVTLHDGVPVPKVIDFGIAKATAQTRLTEETVYTRFEQMIGTPLYMSPEQAEMSGLDIDTRSDIYSLGVLLYELLTGRTPFDPEALRKAGLEEMRRLIREQTPPKPSTALQTMAPGMRTEVARHRRADPAKMVGKQRGDLDWIVMKALEKDRTRRYETANGLVQDLRRHLSGEAVLAAAPTAGYRFGKFARRNKALLGGMALIALILVAATGISLWQALLARRSAAEALTAKGEASSMAAAERTARQELEATMRFLTGVFRSPDPARDGRTISVAETLDKAVKNLDTGYSGQPALKASLQLTLGDSYYALGLAREAVPLQEAALDYYRSVLGPENPATLAAMSSLALSLFDAGRREEAIRLQREILKMRRKVGGPEHSDTLTATGHFAESLFATGLDAEALRLREEILIISRRVSGPEHPDTIRAMHRLAYFHNRQGDREEALRLGEEALRLSRKINGPEHPETLEAMNLGLPMALAGRLDEGIRLQEEALKLSRKINGPEHHRTLRAIQELADSLGAAGRMDEVLERRREALELRCKVDGPTNPDTILAMHEVAEALSLTGQLDEAIRLGEKALELSRGILGFERFTGDSVVPTLHLSGYWIAAGRQDEALKLREDALETSRGVNGMENPATLQAMYELMIFHSTAGSAELKVIKLLEEILELTRKIKGPEHADTIAAMAWLAGNHVFQKTRLGDAIRLQEEVLALHRKIHGPDHAKTLSALQDLALCHVGAAQEARFLGLPEHWDEGLRLLKENLTLRREVYGPARPDTNLAAETLAFWLFEAGRRDEAIRLQQETLAICRGVYRPEDAETRDAMLWLADSFLKAGHQDEAIVLERELFTLTCKAKGPEHNEALTAMGRLATVLTAAGHDREAAALHQKKYDWAQHGGPPPPARAVLVAPNALWRWLHPVSGQNPEEILPGFHKAFPLAGFDDSGWAAGQDSDRPSEGFGYGKSFAGVDIGKPPVEAHRRTAYFRHTFTTDREHAGLELRCRRDDGIIVYLDGREILRDNMNPGPDAYLLDAAAAVGISDENVIRHFPVPGPLSAGTHILAVSVHNATPPSSDLRLGGVTLVELAPETPAK